MAIAATSSWCFRSTTRCASRPRSHDLGIPVPKVYGWIDDVRAFVMDTVPGRPDFNGVGDEERDTVVDEYVQALARLHQLDIGPFVEAGIERAARPEDSGLVGMARFEAVYRRQKHRPDPLMEFGLGWFHRHPPRSRGESARRVGLRPVPPPGRAPGRRSSTSSSAISATR